MLYTGFTAPEKLFYCLSKNTTDTLSTDTYPSKVACCTGHNVSFSVCSAICVLVLLLKNSIISVWISVLVSGIEFLLFPTSGFTPLSLPVCIMEVNLSWRDCSPKCFLSAQCILALCGHIVTFSCVKDDCNTGMQIPIAAGHYYSYVLHFFSMT